MHSLSELDVLVVDCQTTGASPAFGSVLELAWAVVRASAEAAAAPVHAHWIALPPGHTVPERVQKLTGYDPARHAALAVRDADAWLELRGSLKSEGSTPAAIHYARFELSFLRDWSARFQPDTPFPIDAVCVHAIARRMYPSLPRQNLRALAGYLGHGLDLTRSALGHVQATAFVWRRLCTELAARGIDSWQHLHGFLSQSAPKQARSKKPEYPIESARYRNLPDLPGVYQLLRSNGDVLYVGKASSLKKRAASHFRARAGTPQAPEMLTQVSDIRVSVVASALEAALLEHDTIRTLRPPYNVQLTTSDPRVWYSSLEFDSATPGPSALQVIGPLPSEFSLRALGAVSALLGGAACTPALRSGALGVSALWAPDEAVFAAGWTEFRERHRTAFVRAAEQPRRATLTVAKGLLAARGDVAVAEEPDAAPPTPKTDAWDPARVARHLERALAQAYQSYRRARFLRQLQDSDVIYREPASARPRQLTLRGGELVAAGDSVTGTFGDAASALTAGAASDAHGGAASCAASEPASETPAGAASGSGTGRARRQAVDSVAGRPGFDRAKYDRLRILTTELKRIQRDGGLVALRWRRRVLDQALVSKFLRLV